MILPFAVTMDRQLTHPAPCTTLRYPSQHAHPTPPDLAQMPGIVGGSIWTSPAAAAAGEQSHQRHLGDTAKKKIVIAVCQGRACTAKGGAALLQAFCQASSEVIVRPCKCRDACKSAPVVQIQSSAGKQLVKVRGATAPVDEHIAIHDTDPDLFRTASARV